MALKTVWINVYIAPYTHNRFYFSMSYPTRAAAIKGRTKKRTVSPYLGTIKITLDF